MPSNNTKIMSIRVPERVDFGGQVSVAKLVASIYDMWASGGLVIMDNEIVLPEVDCEALRVYEEVKEICHDKNVSIEKFLEIVRRKG